MTDIDKLPEVIESLRALGLVTRDETPTFTALTGGVSSDILLAQVAERRFCIKRALPRLKVAALWEAAVERNAGEAG